MQSYLQHFAAGVVFAAVAGEVLPEIMHERSPVGLIIGFALGVVTMLGIKQITEQIGQHEQGGKALPTRLIVVVGIDLLIDGLLVGVGFAAGAKVGQLLVIALTLEILFLGLSTAAELTEAGAPRRQVIGITAALGIASSDWRGGRRDPATWVIGYYTRSGARVRRGSPALSRDGRIVGGSA